MNGDDEGPVVDVPPFVEHETDHDGPEWAPPPGNGGPGSMPIEFATEEIFVEDGDADDVVGRSK